MVSNAEPAIEEENTDDSSPSDTDAGSERRRKKQTVKTFDFRRPNKFSRDHFRAFQVVHETFSRQLTTALSTQLRAVSQVTLLELEQISYGEYVSTLPNPSFIAIFQLEPLAGYSLMNIPINVAMNAVEYMLGGTGAETPEEGHQLTEIETGLMRDLSTRMLRELIYAHESLFPVEPRLTQVENNPQFAQIAAATDMMLTIRYEIKIGNVEGEISMCIPANSLLPVLEQFTGSHFSEKADVDVAGIRGALSDRLSEANVRIGVRFNEISLTSSEIIDLQVGDILPLNHRTDEPLIFEVEDRPYLFATPGRRGKRIACQIVDTREQL